MSTKYKYSKIIKDQWHVFFSNKKNVYMLIIVFAIPVIYELFRFTPLESYITPYTLSEYPTRWLQERLGTESVIAYISAYYYLVIHLIIMAGLAPLCFFAKRRPPWFYLLLGIIIFIIDTAFYFIYPVAPPSRLDLPYIEPIRLNLFPLSDATISVHYSALPSGHIFISMLGWLIAYIEKWKLASRIYCFNTFFMTFVIVYVGDHYIEDAIASIALVFGVYFMTYYALKRLNWLETEDIKGVPVK